MLKSSAFYVSDFPGLNLSVLKSFLTVCDPIATRQASLSFTISLSLLKLMSFESVMPSNHLILCHPLLLLPSILPSIRVFSSELAIDLLCISISICISIFILLNYEDDLPWKFDIDHLKNIIDILNIYEPL